MSAPNPYQDSGDYQWGPPQPPGTPEYAGPAYGYPHTVPGYGYPHTLPAVPGVHAGTPGMPLLSLGDITVLQDSIVTPAGTLPLKGAVWNVTDMSRTEEKIPTVAIVLAVVFAVFCLLGLFFLLMKEKVTTGFIQVSVSSGGRHHTTMIPAANPGAIQWVMGQVNYARTLSV
ncbi:hypothetical protein V1460_32285 [Streptomyces sp. SCSIO 30461]|uniref:hypothetical protein n=1 Tax=Streptomyces sp. SCSIO 30461 TaxID=3118085 RepID=UPI0030D47BA1